MVWVEAPSLQFFPRPEIVTAQSRWCGAGKQLGGGGWGGAGMGGGGDTCWLVFEDWL